MDKNQLQNEIRRLEEAIADLKKRWPAHSVKVEMVKELEDLEEKLSRLQKKEKGEDCF
ncbi:putative two-component sensor histidine kinase/response regulator hybrid protein [Thermanaeromonas toyohensis ToBE]|uniref:Putative two-component sensor histidine kinase/response regulator hybrid protein n=1 Tax=Thermanaeromonas toyohensis ToBE TaxID=698762 RepID=A0A1W1W2M8_9FIRM|nr:histidine kinase [Thermanaeromonas toyohensis]SMB99858.1 putative two-component sensor histidine kinase/response regulator hybrid protein [Thermanaeromonas toyohensis ToBE]